LTQDLAATREFFAPRAAGWEDRFPDDEPRYRQAVAALGPLVATAVLDVACGTARATPSLREAVGPSGTVVAVDVTWEMLATARHKGRDRAAHLVLANGTQLPLATQSMSAVFAAGYLSHVRDCAEALTELARVTRTGGRLAVFHPIGRAALAARHSHGIAPDDPLDPLNLSPVLETCGWEVESVHDGADRYLVLATRAGLRR